MSTLSDRRLPRQPGQFWRARLVADAVACAVALMLFVGIWLDAGLVSALIVVGVLALLAAVIRAIDGLMD
jgi:hypothetical protein